ncbi:MAG: DNA primase regulatory subunit PriL, partial [Metallosphaera sp.]
VEDILQREHAIDLYTLLTTDGETIKEAKSRIKDIIQGRPIKRLKDYRSPHLVFYAELLILGVINDLRITERIIRKEVELVHNDLLKEGDEELTQIGLWLGINVKLSSIKYHDDGKIKTLNYSIHFLEYLKSIKGRKREFSLSDRIVKSGYVYLDKSSLIRLLSFNIYRKLRDMIKPISIDQIPETVADIIGIKGGRIAPCIKALQEKKDRARDEAFILAVYMLNIGSSVDSVIPVLESAGFEDPIKAIKKIYEEKMIVYSCSKIRDLGLCVANCGTRSPLQLYYGNADITK